MMSVGGAVVEVVSEPVEDLHEVELAVEELAALGAEAAAVEKRAKVLRSTVKEALVRSGVRKFTTSSGHAATLVEATTWRADREVAERVLDVELFHLVFTSATNLSLRVR